MLAIAILLFVSQIRSSGINKSEKSWYITSCVEGNYNVSSIVPASFVTVWLVFAFLNRILSIFHDIESSSSRNWFVINLVKHIDPESDVATRTNLAMLKDHIVDLLEKEPPSRLEQFRFHLHVAAFVLREFMGSFTWEIAWILFSTSYGLTSTIRSWNSCGQPDGEACWGSIRKMTIGQIIPLVLLLLPFLALAESFGRFNEIII
jgi:hypothetical protein